MTSTVQIGDSQRPLENADAQWVTEQINRRRREGEAVCVRVITSKDAVDLALASRDCPGGSGGTRKPNRKEAAIIDDWDRHGLNDRDVAPGRLIAFLKKLC